MDKDNDSAGDELDLLIIGGGPAGMAAALVAGRARLRTVVVNAEAPRNAVTKASHGFLSRDGVPPMELLRIAKSQLTKYPAVDYIVGTVSSIDRRGSGFHVASGEGRRWSAKRIIIATGFRDELGLLSLPGIEEIYGRSAYPCPFCDGFEHADERIAVFADSAIAVHFVPVVRIWSDDVVVFTNGRTALEPDAQALTKRGVRVVDAPVRRIISDDGALRHIELESGECVERDVAFIAEDFSRPVVDFAANLGVARTNNDWGMDVYESTAAGKTNVEGVYVVGDAKSGFGGLTAAAYEGSSCVQHIVHEIGQERWAERGRQ